MVLLIFWYFSFTKMHCFSNKKKYQYPEKLQEKKTALEENN